MSRKYIVSLLSMMLALVVVSLIVMWVKPERFLVIMPFLALYFGIVVGLQHFIVVKSMNKSPKAFVQIYLGTTVAVLFLHIIVLAVYILNNMSHAKLFTMAFCIGYAVSLAFETIALVKFVESKRARH